MSDYIVTGKKGDSKSLVCVGKIRDWLLAGRAVATNLNLNLEHILPLGTRNVRCYRLPDYPSIDDMEAIGMGADVLDESEYGLIVLDEMAVWMNAREWNDKRRQKLLHWFVHSRKKRWHSMFITQGLPQLDKQFRESLADHHVSCRRTDKMRIPFLGVISKNLLGVEIRMPKIHVAAVKYGMDRQAILSDRWTYRGIDLYKGYDTEQVFDESYADGIYSYLSPWHLKGRYGKLPRKISEHVRDFFRGQVRQPNQQKPKLPLVDLLQKLPPDQRLRHYRRLQQAGAL